MNIRRIAPAIAAGMLALTLSACSAGDTSVTFAQPQQSGISVTGQGSVTVAPDIAVISLGVEVSRPTVEEARNEAAMLMTAMQEALARNGVEERDIATLVFSIYPQYSQFRPCVYDAIDDVSDRATTIEPAPAPAVEASAASGSTSGSGGTAITTVTAVAPAAPPTDEEASASSQPAKCFPQEPQIIGFTVNNQLTVKVRDFDRLSDTLDDAITAGGNAVRVNNVSFTIDEPEQYWDEAREASVEDARERAEQLARLAGASLGSLRSISESNNRGGGIYLEYAVPQPASFDGAFSSSTALNPGEQEISLTIYLVYDVN
jgi:uncharacterized protein YggE